MPFDLSPSPRNKNTDNAYRLADYILNLDYGDFDMCDWNRCIMAHACDLWEFPDKPAAFHALGKKLGITPKTANMLCTYTYTDDPSGIRHFGCSITREGAAQAIMLVTLTGIITRPSFEAEGNFYERFKNFAPLPPSKARVMLERIGTFVGAFI